MLPPAVDALYDAFKHPPAERPSLPLLPPVEARAYDHEVRGRVLDLIEHTPADELFTAGMVVQHEEQHDETMLATLQLVQGPPVLLGRRPLPPGRCLVFTQWVAHLNKLTETLRDTGHDPVVLRGGMGARSRNAAAARLTPQPGGPAGVVVATGPSAGEGFDSPALDALLPAATVRTKARLVH